MGHVANNTQNGNSYRVLVQESEVKRNHFEDLKLVGRTKIKCKVIKVNFTL
jgi:hypothetical protein